MRDPGADRRMRPAAYPASDRGNVRGACVIGGTTMDEPIRSSLFDTAILVVGLAAVLAFPRTTLTLPRISGLH